jgi:hypothetical protein
MDKLGTFLIYLPSISQISVLEISICSANSFDLNDKVKGLVR